MSLAPPLGLMGAAKAGSSGSNAGRDVGQAYGSGAVSLLGGGTTMQLTHTNWDDYAGFTLAADGLYTATTALSNASPSPLRIHFDITIEGDYTGSTAVLDLEVYMRKNASRFSTDQHIPLPTTGAGINTGFSAVIVASTTYAVGDQFDVFAQYNNTGGGANPGVMEVDFVFWNVYIA